jgi:hypothetical protein
MIMSLLHDDRFAATPPARPTAAPRRMTRWIAALAVAVGLILSGGSAAQAAVPAAASDRYADAYIARVCAVRGATSVIKVCSQRQHLTIYQVRVIRCTASHLAAPVTPSAWSAAVFISKYNYWWYRCWNNNAEGW